MTKLEKLYAIIQNSKELGLDLGEDVIRQTNELEEKIIRDEILPIIGKNIEPTLRQIKRKIVLVVDYDPDQPLSVRMTRKRVITDEKDTKKYPLLPLSKHIETKKSQKQHIVVNPRSSLRVTFPNGKVIQEGKALSTFISALEEIGLQKVSDLNISLDRQNFVTRAPVENGTHASWHRVGNWFVNTHSSSSDKARYLRKISNALHLNLKIEIF